MKKVDNLRRIEDKDIHFWVTFVQGSDDHLCDLRVPKMSVAI